MYKPDRQWLAEFLNYCPNIDPHDDEAELVDDMLKFAPFIRAAVTGMLKSRHNIEADL